MNNCAEILSKSNSINKRKISNAAKSLKGDSFGSIFNKIVTDKIADSIKQNSTITSNSSAQELDENFSEKLEEEMNQRADDDVERLANFFGIGKHLMKAILQGLHIDPKDLLDPSKKKKIVDTLIKKFGLDKNRAEALANVITDFQK
ncbi:hypothetical protein Ccar_09265 [Clostridium carboxidivorans P7]|uniref:Uncharacterized protein n=1 Tax=Clostridium carboxidivorans P7 TaxID=536227 RepID=C6PRQ4_9CLOT|nr:hypothetical protein [Clostridium carboxidivorans]AKN31027.1 hypothetical protein Ccar_09265 [Clostridium carboxidivorans P7]EET88097.1 hypothetical protein CcarbDRAFT_1471 [Clostridium carboxidivorans P7]EFG88712.1 hypothetical protein CLCAR_1457 [Clostridium carboxidivorans P7]